MKSHTRFDALHHRPAIGRRDLLLGVWLRSAFLGGAFAVAGFAALFATPPALPLLTAVTWVLAGATFAWLAWERAKALLDRIDTDGTAQADRDRMARPQPLTRAPAAS